MHGFFFDQKQDFFLALSFSICARIFSADESDLLFKVNFLRAASDLFVLLRGAVLLQDVEMDQDSALLAKNRNENSTEAWI